jgi:hypothetical protein
MARLKARNYLFWQASRGQKNVHRENDNTDPLAVKPSLESYRLWFFKSYNVGTMVLTDVYFAVRTCVSGSTFADTSNVVKIQTFQSSGRITGLGNTFSGLTLTPVTNKVLKYITSQQQKTSLCLRYSILT